MTTRDDDTIKKAARLLFEQDNHKLALVRAEGKEEKLGRVFQVMVERAGPDALSQYEERARAAFELAERFPVARADLGDQHLIEALLRGQGDFRAVGIQSAVPVMPGQRRTMCYQPSTMVKLLRLVVDAACAPSFSIERVVVGLADVLLWSTPASMFWQPRPVDPEPLRLSATVELGQVVSVHVRNTSERECRFDGALGFFIPHERIVELNKRHVAPDVRPGPDGRYLRAGSRGRLVHLWQKWIGVDGADGIWDERTEELTRLWQERWGLKVDGVVDTFERTAREGLYLGRVVHVDDANRRCQPATVESVGVEQGQIVLSLRATASFKSWGDIRPQSHDPQNVSPRWHEVGDEHPPK